MQSGQMKYAGGSKLCEGVENPRPVAHVHSIDGIHVVRHPVGLAAREIIENGYDRCRRQALNDVATDETGSAGDENSFLPHPPPLGTRQALRSHRAYSPISGSEPVASG